jgi:hypothetical protein
MLCFETDRNPRYFSRDGDDTLPDAQLKRLPDAGHLCWLDNLDHAADTVRNHLPSEVTTNTA